MGKRKISDVQNLKLAIVSSQDWFWLQQDGSPHVSAGTIAHDILSHCNILYALQRLRHSGEYRMKQACGMRPRIMSNLGLTYLHLQPVPSFSVGARHDACIEYKVVHHSSHLEDVGHARFNCCQVSQVHCDVRHVAFCWQALFTETRVGLLHLLNSFFSSLCFPTGDDDTAPMLG